MIDGQKPNKPLFSQHYLAHRIQECPEWLADVEEGFEALKKLYLSKKDLLPTLSEAQTEDVFIKPALDILGFSNIPQVTTRGQGRAERPDYALFTSEADRDAAYPLQHDQSAFYGRVRAIAEAKYWKRPLSKVSANDKRDIYKNTNPSFQISSYLTGTGVDWGILTNGCEWRLYYRQASSTATEFYQVDLVALIDAADVEQFKYFWLFFRQAAFLKDSQGRNFLERVREGSTTYATRVGSELKALVFDQVFPGLAGGFVADAIYRKEQVTADQVHEATLSFLYKLLFLLYAEARNLLPIDGDYWDYSLISLTQDIAKVVERQKSLSQTSAKMYDYLLSLFQIVDRGDAGLGVPRYNGGLFHFDFSAASDQEEYRANHFLFRFKLSDAVLAPVLDKLARFEGQPIDYSFLGVRQLGSIYEGLLEYRVVIADAAAGLVHLENDKGERKATGSYYTPDYIVKYIVSHTLKPILAGREARFSELMAQIDQLHSQLKDKRLGDQSRNGLGKDLKRLEREAQSTLLDIKVCDPAMGSGHFLVEAVDYLTDELIRILTQYPDHNPVLEMLEQTRSSILQNLEQQGITINPDRLEPTQLLQRVVMKRCIYGVDLNVMAVELAKVSLWLHSFTIGAPLSFLDHHLRCGNSLIGTTAREAEANMSQESTGQFNLLSGPFVGLLRAAEIMRGVSVLSDATFAEVEQSETLFRSFDAAAKPYKRLLDIYVAKYFGLKRAEFFLRVFGTGALRFLQVDPLPKSGNNIDPLLKGGSNIDPLPQPLSQGGRGEPEVDSYDGRGGGERWEISEGLRLRMVEVAQGLRRSQTPTEQTLWQQLRAKKRGYKVRRQQPIGVFVVDFYVAQSRLVIEVDGSVHAEQQQLDQERQSLLEQLGLKFLRFSTADIEQNLDQVLQAIDREVENPHHPPSPLLPQGEKGELERVSLGNKRSQKGSPAPLSRSGRGVGGEGLNAADAALITDAEQLQQQKHFFHWDLEFPEVFIDLENANWKDNPGFDAVVGNPPYVRQEGLSEFKPFFQAWYESYSGAADLYTYFYEKGLKILQRGGQSSYIVTNKWLRAGYGEPLRRFFAANSQFTEIVDFGHAPIFPDADTFPCIVVVKKLEKLNDISESLPPTNQTVRICPVPREALSGIDLDGYVGSEGYDVPWSRFSEAPWSLERPDVGALIEKIQNLRISLKDYLRVKPYRGITTGLNEAFLINEHTKNKLIQEDSRSESIIYPYLRGQDVKRWFPEWQNLWIIVIKSSSDLSQARYKSEEKSESEFSQLYPSIYKHLKTLEPQLRKRYDKGKFWWELRACDYYEVFEQDKYVIQRIAFHSRVGLDKDKNFINDAAIMIPTSNTWGLACLNSPLLWYFCYRYLPHKKDEALAMDIAYVEQFPIAPPTDAIREQTEPKVQQLIDLTKTNQQAYRDVLDWMRSRFEIEKLGQKLERFATLSEAEFLAELRKRIPKKGKISDPLGVAGQKEVKEIYGDHALPMQTRNRKILKLEHQVSDLVNQAYGLTPEDIDLMWRTAPPRMPIQRKPEAEVAIVEGKHG